MNRILGLFPAALRYVVVVALALGLAGFAAVDGPAGAAEPGTITGVVTSSVDGAPLARVGIIVFIDDRAVGLTATDAEGHFVFENTHAPFGPYRLQFTSDTTITQWYGGGESPESGEPVEVAPGDSTHLAVTLEPAGVVRGTYDGPAPVAVEVEVEVPAYNASLWAKATIGGGKFSARVTTAQPFAVGLVWGSPTSRSSIAAFNGNKLSWTNAPKLTVAPGKELTGVHITKPATVKLTGRVVTAKGFGIRVNLTPTVLEDGAPVNLGNYVQTRSDPMSGEFDLIVPAVPVTLKATGETDSDGFQSRWLGGATSVSEATFVEPGPATTLAVGDISLPGGHTVSGVVRDAAGDPVPAVTVTALGGHRNAVKGSAVSDADGQWSIAGLGAYAMDGVSLRYSHDRIEPAWRYLSSELASGQFLETTVDYVPAYRLTATGAPAIAGSPVTGLTVEVEPTTVTPAPTATRFQWLCDGAPIDATGTSLPLAHARAGCVLTVRQTSTLAGFGPAIVDSAPVKVMAPAATTRPTIVGTLGDGYTLKVRKPTWNYAPDVISYQWRRNGAAIRGATRSSYKLTTADVAKRITVQVNSRASATGLSATSTSGWPRIILARSRVSIKVTGTSQSGKLSVRITTPGQSSPGGSVTYRISSRGVLMQHQSLTFDKRTPTQIVYGVSGNLEPGWNTINVRYRSPYAMPSSATVRYFARVY